MQIEGFRVYAFCILCGFFLFAGQVTESDMNDSVTQTLSSQGAHELQFHTFSDQARVSKTLPLNMLARLAATSPTCHFAAAIQPDSTGSLTFPAWGCGFWLKVSRTLHLEP